MSEAIFHIGRREDMEKWELWRVGWYFLDESGEAVGPHDSKMEAQTALNIYIREFLGETPVQGGKRVEP